MHVTPPTGRVTDPFAIDGKFHEPDEHAQLLVVGAGPAGLASAIHAAQLGLKVVLIDENPVSAGLMGLDVPLFYGQRMNASVQEPARMIERLVASMPGLEAAFDAGVDVRLGHTVWGVFANGAGLRALPTNMAGLSDGAQSWMCGFDALILATGARDLVLGFPGADLPGVMGACALQSLLTRYDAFDGKRLVIVGSGDLAVETALLALDRGLHVTTLLETFPQPQTDARMVAKLTTRGVEIRTGVISLRAVSAFAGVAAVLAMHDCSDSPERFECDTVCLAIGAVPVIELAAALGCEMVFRGDLGGYVARLSRDGETSVSGVFCVGECAGVSSQACSESQGRHAAEVAAARILGSTPPSKATEHVAQLDTTPYRIAWMRALMDCGDDQVQVCFCEELTRAELLGIKPPRYLACRFVARDSTTLRADGPLNPDQIKRLTRAGMGTCQGRRCREQIALMLAIVSDTPLENVPLASYRAPARPLALGVLAGAATLPGWDVWFGIPTQWIPYDMIGTDAEARLLESGGGGNMHA